MTRGEEMLSQKKTGLETARISMIIGDYKFRKGFSGEGGTKFASIFPAWNIASLSLVIYPETPLNWIIQFRQISCSGWTFVNLDF